MSGNFDAIVIGGDASGLAASAYLAKAGLKTVLLEKAEAIAASGEPVLHALDPRVVKELKLGRHGLTFVFRDLSLVTLRPGAAPLTVPRDSRHVARGVAALSPADAQALPHYLNQLFALGRALRLSWWDGRPLAETLAALKPSHRALAERLTVTSAASFTASWFETDALRAALAFDATRAGFAPTEPGSALALAWSASQEMSGMQGASALPRGGLSGLIQALATAAQKAGVEIRTVSTAHSLMFAGDRVAGVELTAGERIEAPIVLSTLSRRRTLALAPTAASGLGAAQHAIALAPASVSLVFGLNRQPDLSAALFQPGSRHIVADKPEMYATALGAVRLGTMPDEPALELVLPPPEFSVEALASRIQLHARAWPVLPGDDRDTVVRTVTAAIERLMPGFSGRIASCDVLPGHESDPPSVARLAASSAERIATAIPGLYLCGMAAEPADAVSCRAARQAARMAISQRHRNEPR
jgi:phytoene dehydrogenase-like protein